MKCQICSRWKGTARCEGCQILVCAKCLVDHQNELERKFHDLIDERNRLVERAPKSEEIQRNLREISADLLEKQKEKQFLENDIEEIQRRLEELGRQIDAFLVGGSSSDTPNDGNALRCTTSERRISTESKLNDVRQRIRDLNVSFSTSTTIPRPSTPQRSNESLPIVEQTNRSEKRARTDAQRITTLLKLLDSRSSSPTDFRHSDSNIHFLCQSQRPEKSFCSH